MRLPKLTRDEMTPAQREAYDATVAGKRGRISPPVEAWLHSPELANRAQRLGEFVRFDLSLPQPLAEMAILITARHFGASYEWYAHKKLALQAGLDPAIIDAIRDGVTPDLPDAGARAIHAFATTLHRTRTVPKTLYDDMVAAYGTKGVVELVGLLGYYALVSMTLNAFDVELPDGETPEIFPPA
jgi:4-carboxymuconolactone decarboxylase